MKKSLLLSFLLIMFIIPVNVKGEALYVNHGEYNYSDTYIEERKDLEVKTITEEGKTVYKYRTRDYIIIPSSIIIKSRDFNIFDIIDTNLPKEEIVVKEYYDLKTMNNRDSTVVLKYKEATMAKLVTIKIENYIEIPKEIIVTNNDFNIWDYIDTDINIKEDIVFVGEYNLSINGEYELGISYKNISKKTKIIVNIKDNDIDKNEEVPDEKEEEIIEKEGVSEEKKEPVIEEKVSKEITTCVNNYYEITDTVKEVEYIDRVVPVNKKIEYISKDNNKYFRYISYVFYGINTILLSIIVVQKK